MRTRQSSRSIIASSRRSCKWSKIIKRRRRKSNGHRSPRIIVDWRKRRGGHAKRRKSSRATKRRSRRMIRASFYEHFFRIYLPGELFSAFFGCNQRCAPAKRDSRSALRCSNVWPEMIDHSFRMEMSSGDLLLIMTNKKWQRSRVNTADFLRICDSVRGEVARDGRSFSKLHRPQDWRTRRDDRRRTSLLPLKSTDLERRDEERLLIVDKNSHRCWMLSRHRAIVDDRAVAMYWMSSVCAELGVERIVHWSTSIASGCWAKGWRRREWSSQWHSKYSSLKS